MNYHQKSKKEKCPTCQQTIVQYSVVNTGLGTVSAPFEFKELLGNGPEQQVPTESAFDCLDHTYFRAEIAKLISLRNEIEIDRFHRRIGNKDPTLQKNLDLQWTAIK